MPHKKINPNKCLPQELRAKYVDDILYEIGFCDSIGFTLDSIKAQSERPLVFNRVFKFSFFSMYLFDELRNSFEPVNDPASLFIVTFAELMGVPRHILFYISCASLLALGTQFRFRYNPFNGLNETNVGVFQKSGSVPPIRLGLTNEQLIRRLVKITKFGLKVSRFQNYFVFPLLFLDILLTLYSANSSLEEFSLAFGIINAIYFLFWTIYVVGIIDNILLTILINCFHFKFKIN